LPLSALDFAGIAVDFGRPLRARGFDSEQRPPTERKAVEGDYGLGWVSGIDASGDAAGAAGEFHG
jgi:hypothetical protein